MPLGTKNLGLIKAIHVGVNPPLNTKILWYNDATTPYTTGPAKVHYYYDVILADWYPLVGVGDGTGTFTYIAFASNCDGTNDFALEMVPDVHCYWAIHTSPTEVDPGDLLPALFEDKWTQFCRCTPDQDGVGTYTYIAFADDCDGTNFSLDPMYEVECTDCVYADSYNISSGSSAFSISPVPGGEGIQVDITNAVAGNEVRIDLTLNSLPLTDLIDYCVAIDAPVGYVGEVEIHLGDEPNKLLLNTPTTDWKNTLQNNGSQLWLKIPDTYVGSVTAQITIRVGTAECCSFQEGDKCYCCHEYWAVVVSETAIDPLDASVFENRWIKIGANCDCSCDCEGQFDILERQIDALNTQLLDYMAVTNQRVSDLEVLVNNLQTQINDCCEGLQAQINALQQQLDNFINGTRPVIDDHSERIPLVEAKADANEAKFTQDVIGPLAIPQIDSKLAVFERTVDEKDSSVRAYADEKEASARLYADESIAPLGETQSSQQATLDDHETRITALEP